MNNNLLKETREQRGFTQEYMARKLDISLRNYQFIEAYKTKPNIYLGLKIAKLLNINPYLIFPINL